MKKINMLYRDPKEGGDAEEVKTDNGAEQSAEAGQTQESQGNTAGEAE